MTTLREQQAGQGAVYEQYTGVPTHFGDLAGAYAAAHEAVVLIDRSDEGRIMLAGDDRLAILHRLSTNAVEALAPGGGRATVLTTPVGRIIDRVILHALTGEQTLLRTSSNRAQAVAGYLQRNIFFRDRMTVTDVTAEFVQLALYGPAAPDVAASLVGDSLNLPPSLHHVVSATCDGGPLWVMILDPVGVPGIGLTIPAAQAAALWQAALEAGGSFGIRPAGSSVYEVLRIEAGLPGPAGELNEDYIPLEADLWADVSFTKGCYTGQEVIARMESRGKLAKILVGVSIDGPATAGTAWRIDKRRQGVLTSVARRPDGQWIGLGFVRPDVADVGQVLALEDGGEAVIRLTGRGALES